MTARAPRIRVVVWDLDDTVWEGVALEAGDALPAVREPVRHAVATLVERGIVCSIASRNPPELAARLAGDPFFATFVAPQIGWGWKSDALVAIARRLQAPLDTVAFVDDDPFERAEVAAALPDVLVLDAGAVGEWLHHERLAGGPGTAEAARRVAILHDHERRDAAEATFAGDRTAFLRSCEIELTARPATAADATRIAELAERTTQYNTSGRRYEPAALADRLAASTVTATVFSLCDRFGDDGLVGVAVLARSAAGEHVVELLAVSCRAAGRGIVAAVIAWLVAEVRAIDPEALVRVPVVATSRNGPIRLALRQCGLRAEPGAGAGAGADRDADAPAFVGTASTLDARMPAWITLR